MTSVLSNFDAEIMDCMWIQGFIDREGKFHDRESAWKIAKDADQIVRYVGNQDARRDESLYSENLY
jgi:hypothetical protein